MLSASSRGRNKKYNVEQKSKENWVYCHFMYDRSVCAHMQLIPYGQYAICSAAKTVDNKLRRNSTLLATPVIIHADDIYWVMEYRGVSSIHNDEGKGY